jgi:hypothetical protein
VLTSSGAYHMEWVSGNSVPEGKSGRAWGWRLTYI